ncbi:hypothetical protein [Paenibacillus hamazuiensis]|uniref:hypothetical protein n=1 Tax=Paenibacillus hamazuiensis TaxID=2936508 RepID=UPI0020101466|nr:hypothetical protein [Paenibacillus hamazuiensis]
MIAFGQTATAMAEGEHYMKADIEETLALPVVSIGEGSYIELKRAAILPADGGKTLFFTITAVNGSDREIAFADYWVRPYSSSSGMQFTAELLPQDKSKNEIPAGGRMDFSFYAVVGDAAALQDIALRVTKWDYTLETLERPVGDIRFRTDDLSYLRPGGSSRVMEVGTVPVRGTVSRMLLKKNEKYYFPQFTLRLVNEGEASVPLPDYQYALRTADGVMFPLDTAGGEKLSLPPRVTKELQLKSSGVPAATEFFGAELVVTQTFPGNGDGKVTAPVAFFRIPDTSDTPVSLGQDYEYSNPSGLYSLKADQLQRLPWDDQDLLTAQLTITNKDESGLPIPELRAYYVLDDGVKIEAKAVKIDRQVGLPAGQETFFKLIGKIPYDYRYGSAKLLIQEKNGDSSYVDVCEFALPLEYKGMPSITYGSKRPVSGSGRNLLYAPRTVHTYTDKGSKLYEVQVEVENTDKRSAAVPKLAAYLETPEHAIFPTKVREVKAKLNPEGKALVSFWAKLPKEMSTDGLKLILGDAVTDNHLSGFDDKPDAFLDAAVFDLPVENTMVSPDLRNVELYPYTVSIWNISTWLDASQLRINFLYDLSKDSYYETSTDGQKLVLQLEDSNGNISMTQKFYFEKGPDDDDVYLELGEHSYKWVKSDKDLIANIQTLKTYKLSIYHEFQGQSKLLASKEITWFGLSD